MRILTRLSCIVLVLVGAAQAADSLNVRRIGFCPTSDWALGVAASGDYAYVAAFHAGLRVILVADPAHPVEVGYFGASGNQMRSVEVVGNLAYVADCDSSLRIISVTDPSTPVEVGRVELPARAMGIDVSGGYAYVADDDSGLRVVSVADPAHPVEVGHYAGVRGAIDVVVVGDYAYVADNGNGLCVVSVADPSNPVEVGRYVGTGRAYGVAVSGGCAYLAAGSSGLRIDSIADPAHPFEVGYCDSLGSATDVEVTEDFAHVAAWNGPGYSVVSVSDPEHPVVVGHYGIGNAGSVALRGGYAYVVGYAGLHILQFYGEAVEEAPIDDARQASTIATVVRGTLALPTGSSPMAEPMSLLDASGREVLRLRPGANDVSGVRRGVYFVREESQASSHKLQAARKIILVK